MFSSICSRHLLKNSNICVINRSSGVSTKFSSSPISENDNVSEDFQNRNPRNLEKLRIAWKPQGYHLEAPGRNFWHKLILTRSSRYVTAQVVHYSGKVVIEASTKEWCIQKQLYSCVDRSAFENLARVLAQRCLECGLTEMESGIGETDPKTKVGIFAKKMQESGVTLQEPPRYVHPLPWQPTRPEKSWEITE